MFRQNKNSSRDRDAKKDIFENLEEEWVEIDIEPCSDNKMARIPVDELLTFSTEEAHELKLQLKAAEEKTDILAKKNLALECIINNQSDTSEKLIADYQKQLLAAEEKTLAATQNTDKLLNEITKKKATN